MASSCGSCALCCHKGSVDPKTLRLYQSRRRKYQKYKAYEGYKAYKMYRVYRMYECLPYLQSRMSQASTLCPVERHFTFPGSTSLIVFVEDMTLGSIQPPTRFGYRVQDFRQETQHLVPVSAGYTVRQFGNQPYMVDTFTEIPKHAEQGSGDRARDDILKPYVDWVYVLCAFLARGNHDTVLVHAYVERSVAWAILGNSKVAEGNKGGVVTGAVNARRARAILEWDQLSKWSDSEEYLPNAWDSVRTLFTKLRRRELVQKSILWGRDGEYVGCLFQEEGKELRIASGTGELDLHVHQVIPGSPHY